MDQEQIREIVARAVPEARVMVEDLSGSGDHFQVVVVSEAFSGMSLVEQHRLVYAPLREALAERIHALSIKTYTPAQLGEG